ncbi:MAG: hypothetical protein LAT57_13965, partial [Balneolales bacterium]|nr:hypothetical protein [Balneolales bacterium]
MQKTSNEIQVTSSRADFYAMVERESEMGDVVVLDSQLATHPSSGKSWLFAGFDAIFKWNQETDGDSSSVGDPWKALAGFRSRFPGFCCGYLGYDLKNAREVLQSENNDDVGLPDMWMARPTRIYMLEEESNEGEPQKNADSSRINSFMANSSGDKVKSETSQGSDAGKTSNIKKDSGSSQTNSKRVETGTSSSTHPINFTITSLRSSVSCDHYKRMVEKAKALIHEGDTYE